MTMALGKSGRASFVCCRLAELPDAVGGLTQLQSLSLASCGLHQLPDAFGRLQRLSALDVRHNSLQQLPASLGKPAFPGMEMPDPLAAAADSVRCLMTCSCFH